mgnify:CR=1 FL=1
MEQPQGSEVPKIPKEEDVLADTIRILTASIDTKTKELTIVGRESDLGLEIQGQIDAAKIELVVATKSLRTILAFQELEKELNEKRGDEKYIKKNPNNKTMGIKGVH